MRGDLDEPSLEDKRSPLTRENASYTTLQWQQGKERVQYSVVERTFVEKDQF